MMKTEAFLPRTDDTLIVHFDAIYEPERYGSSIEDCSPDCSEMRINAVFHNNVDILDDLDDEELDLIEQKCWDEFFDDMDNGYDE